METAPAKILIVDDETALMTALCITLKDEGYDTTGFSSGKAALAAMEKTEFDLLLTDLMMPEMDGIALLQAALKKSPNIVGLIMTGEGTIATAVEAMKTGALDYILKPFRLSVVLPILGRALTIRRLRLENVILAQSVRERSAQLEAANRELEAFSYSVSHDLRAPVRHIDGFVSLLAKAEMSLSEKGQSYLDAIAKSSKQMGCLIDDLLEFSRTGRTEMRHTQVDLQNVLTETFGRIQPETKGRNIQWKTSPLPVVQGDPILLQQVFSNLLLNAVKYTGPRDPAEIEIGWTGGAGDETVVFVRDNGVGFDMRYAGKLFGVFQRLHRQDEFEGTGIGLANVRRIVARHGGRTWAEGEIDKGATFYFSLPPIKPAAGS
jgi:signal transduction histidine kinase